MRAIISRHLSPGSMVGRMCFFLGGIGSVMGNNQHLPGAPRMALSDGISLRTHGARRVKPADSSCCRKV
jgi:hypothetical protein